MNNRFKFRVWNKREDCYIETPQPTPLLQSDGVLAYFSNNPEAMNFYDIEFCTGLKDKNGKLIYEGDIVQDVEDPLYVSVVMWDEIDLRWKTKGRGYEIVGSVYPENHIVIGNIHENPELLKESK